jgi:hypothetical protein
MSSTTSFCVLGLLLGLLGALQAAGPDATGADSAGNLGSGQYSFSGPYTHDNLTVFLIHGSDRLAGKPFLTLQEALEQKKAIVHETKAVNQLAVENLSSSEEILIQAGDIVKGGQQDRVLAIDLILPPKSGKMSIDSFCVESGRWRGRGKENVNAFDSSEGQVPTKDLKLAVRQSKSQGMVWDKVAAMQRVAAAGIAATPGASIDRTVQRRGMLASSESPTSLQLTLEHKSLQEALKGYLQALTTIVDGKKDVVGYAAVVNGRISSAEIYGSHALFAKLWQVLLKGSAVEAIAERASDKKQPPLSADAVQTFLADIQKAKATEQPITDRLLMVKRETPKGVMFETHDRNQQDALIRRSFVGK